MSLRAEIDETLRLFTSKAVEIHTERWQGLDIRQRRDAGMREMLFHHFEADIPETLDELRQQVRPNLPWADDHFEQERVSREPINPGETWKTWPWAHGAAGHLEDFGRGPQFNHTYAERYWPRSAGMTPGGKLHGKEWAQNLGIRHWYGDLAGVVRLLAAEPLTRQAILPVWFPEDTGDWEGRKPCSLFYQFLMRQGRLHINYSIRSCDIVRHFRDDIYLTCRLALWVLEEVRKLDRLWLQVKPGSLIMQIGSLHCFQGDFPGLRDATES